MDLDTTIRWTGTLIDAAGVAVIALGVVAATVKVLHRAAVRSLPGDTYHEFREIVGRSILLGLELLVAGDIIRTVAIRPTFSSVGVLVVIVLVRTFLSWTLEVELSGRFPWQRR
ncbi:DUF1622 domain-containing protein [Polyangium sp. 15x6]|uniref:DUF1622 domain-containing protein n=1 Tax=Polyangium sp. 15x6 TaxID=3042687 RepID=UPI00249BF72B|nr:DUF1622 domain-containing protein [Polyangium sp. 15x6]MDI3283914.1 DUF1622 domain-containing protein [Polyangium sp. 15x6]